MKTIEIERDNLRENKVQLIKIQLYSASLFKLSNILFTFRYVNAPTNFA